jgi:hypothetical protein
MLSRDNYLKYREAPETWLRDIKNVNPVVAVRPWRLSGYGKLRNAK